MAQWENRVLIDLRVAGSNLAGQLLIYFHNVFPVLTKTQCQHASLVPRSRIKAFVRKLRLAHSGLRPPVYSHSAKGAIHSHRKGGNKEAIFHFGDRFCYVNESRALELYSHSLTQLLFSTRFFFKAIHFSFLFFWVGGSGTQYYKIENLK